MAPFQSHPTIERRAYALGVDIDSLKNELNFTEVEKMNTKDESSILMVSELDNETLNQFDSAINSAGYERRISDSKEMSKSI